MTTILSSDITLSVRIKNPQETLYEGNAQALSFVSTTGPFDVLPYHANLIALIKDSIIVYETKDQKKEIKIEEGILKVFENSVDVFLGIKTIE